MLRPFLFAARVSNQFDYGISRYEKSLLVARCLLHHCCAINQQTYLNGYTFRIGKACILGEVLYIGDDCQLMLTGRSVDWMICVSEFRSGIDERTAIEVRATTPEAHRIDIGHKPFNRISREALDLSHQPISIVAVAMPQRGNYEFVL